MSTTVTITDKLAAALEAQRKRAGIDSLDAAAEALLSKALSFAAEDAGDFGLTPEALRSLIDEGEASGPVVPWDGAEVRSEVQRRHDQRG
jgi:hypothetical protein